MRWSGALSLAAALTVAALAIKGAALTRTEPVEQVPDYLGRLGERLAAQGFAVRIERGIRLVAWRGGCRFRARDLPPMGTTRRSIEQLDAPFGPTRYAWRERWRAAPPKVAPLFVYYVQRELARIGVGIERSSIAAVSAGPACGVLPAAWFDLSIRQG